MSRWLTSLAVFPLLLAAGCGKDEAASPAAQPGTEPVAMTTTPGMPGVDPAATTPGVTAPGTPGTDTATLSPMPGTETMPPTATTPTPGIETAPTLPGPGNPPMAPATPGIETTPANPALPGPGNPPMAPATTPGTETTPANPALPGPGNPPMAPATTPGTETTPATPTAPTAPTAPGTETTPMNPGEGNPGGNVPKFEAGTPEAVVQKIVLQTAAGKQDGLEDVISEEATGKMAKLRKQELTEEEVQDLKEQTEQVKLVSVSEGATERVVKLYNSLNKMLEFRLVKEKEAWRVKNLYVKTAPRVLPNRNTNR